MVKSYSSSDIDKLRLARWKARTDLGFLCREVLGYKDVDDYVHGPLMRALQAFPKPNRAQFTENDVWTGKTWIYRPVFRHVQDLKGTRRRLILAHRGLMKCVEPNQLLRLKDGTYRKAKDIALGDVIASQSSEGSFERGWSTVTGVEIQAPQEAYLIKLKSGRQVIVSHEHPFRTFEGWVDAKNLSVGNRVAVHGISDEPENPQEVPDAELLGWMIGDGNCTSCRITNTDPFLQTRILGLCERLGIKAHLKNYRTRAANICVLGYRERLRDLGLMGTLAGTKFVPEVMFKAGNDSVKRFLYGLFMADGTLGRDTLFLTTKSEMLARGTQRLLLRLGIWSKVAPFTTKYRDERRKYFVVRVTSTEMITKFISEIGWDKHSRFEPKKSNPNINTVPREWRKRYGQYIFGRGNVPRDLVWDYVEACVPVGPIETVAIQTDTKTLCIDDVVTHNTTLNLQAHSIQWIINYPSVALAIFQSNLDKSEDILKSIRHHFRNNETFRRLFPEHCPQSKVEDWGLKSEFTTLARPKSESRREPTIKALSIDKENAGYHFDAMKFSDIVEPGTTKTEGAMDNTRREFSLAESLLVSPVYWMDVEGTRYTAKEMYQDIIDKWFEEERRGLPHSYEIFMQGCYKRMDPKTKEEQKRFTPDTLDWPLLLDASGNEVPWWPKDASGAPRFPLHVLKEKQRKDPYDFSCQYLLKPQAGIDGAEAFPLEDLQKVSYENYLKNVRPRVKFFTIGLDTAHTTNARSNYTAFTVCAWDGANRPYVVKIIRKKLQPSEIVEYIFRLNEEYKPRSFVIEETQFVSGLRVQIETELGKKRAYYRQNHIPWNIDFIKPENDKSKEQRIQNTLQPLYKAKTLRFVVPETDRTRPTYNEEDIDAYEALLKELKDFPLAATDDILDSLADQFQPKSWFGRLSPRELGEVSETEMKRQFANFLGIGPETSGGRPFPRGGDAFKPPIFG